MMTKTYRIGLKAALQALALALLTAAACALAAVAVPGYAHADEDCLEVQAAGAADQMHRLYNPWSGEHFYTANASEKDHLVSLGWNYEGTGWYAPKSGADVHRLYNRWSGDHHFTTSASEKDACVAAGWTYEGVGWKSGGSVRVYREYNPYAPAFYHNYTAAASEHSHLCSIGWRDEGVGWYGVAHDHSWQEVTKQVTQQEAYEVNVVVPSQHDPEAQRIWSQLNYPPELEFSSQSEALAFMEAFETKYNRVLATGVATKYRTVTKSVVVGYRCTGCGATR